MDIKIENRDIVLNSDGTPVILNRLESAVQRLKLFSIVLKGSFVYDRKMGMDVLGKSFMNKDYTLKMIEAMMYEVLIDLPDIKVTVVSLQDSLRYKIATCVITDGYESVETEVTIFENL